MATDFCGPSQPARPSVNTPPRAYLRLPASELLIKAGWKGARSLQLWSRFIFYRALQGVYFAEIGMGTKIYGPLRFGNVPGRVEVGRNCMLGADLFFSAGDAGRICIGDDCSINTGGHLVAVERIEIGSGTLIGEYVSIRDQNHDFSDASRRIREQGFQSRPVKIGGNVWIGRGCFIGAGVEIGDGAVVGANSVVTRSVPPGAVAVGAPAKVVKMRK